jgi:ketosteroid isomerase-like protein
MKTVTLVTNVLLIGTVLLGVFTPTIAHADAGSEIMAAQESIARGAETRNLDLIMSNYLRSDKLFVFDVYPPRAYVGYNAFRKDWHDFLAAFDGPIIYKMVDPDVDTDGKLGCVHVIEHVEGRDKHGNKVDMNLRVTDIYRKIDSKWLIVHEHASVPVDINTDKADVLSKP